MTDNDNSSTKNDRPTNLVQFECQEVKNKYGLEKFPDVPTERLLVSLKDMIKNMSAFF
jgi:hypothetical protein